LQTNSREKKQIHMGSGRQTRLTTSKSGDGAHPNPKDAVKGIFP